MGERYTKMRVVLTPSCYCVVVDLRIAPSLLSKTAASAASPCGYCLVRSRQGGRTSNGRNTNAENDVTCENRPSKPFHAILHRTKQFEQ